MYSTCIPFPSETVVRVPDSEDVEEGVPLESVSAGQIVEQGWPVGVVVDAVHADFAEVSGKK